MAIPDYQALMLPVLTLAAEGEIRVPIAADAIADKLGLTEQDREEMLPSGKQRLLHNRIHWAKFYLHKAGLVEIPRRGVFSASPSGVVLLKSRPEKIDVELLKSFPPFAEYYSQFQSGQRVENIADVDVVPVILNATPEEQIDAAHAMLTSALRVDLLARVLEQRPSFFERLIVDLLVAMGYGGSHEDAARQLGRVDKRDSQSLRLLIQDCFLRSSHGSRRLVGCGVGADRAAASA